MHRAIQQKGYSLIKIQIKWLISSQYNNAKISNVFSKHKNSLAQKKNGCTAILSCRIPMYPEVFFF